MKKETISMPQKKGTITLSRKVYVIPKPMIGPQPKDSIPGYLVKKPKKKQKYV